MCAVTSRNKAHNNIGSIFTVRMGRGEMPQYKITFPPKVTVT